MRQLANRSVTVSAKASISRAQAKRGYWIDHNATARANAAAAIITSSSSAPNAEITAASGTSVKEAPLRRRPRPQSATPIRRRSLETPGGAVGGMPFRAVVGPTSGGFSRKKKPRQRRGSLESVAVRRERAAREAYYENELAAWQDQRLAGSPPAPPVALPTKGKAKSGRAKGVVGSAGVGRGSSPSASIGRVGILEYDNARLDLLEGREDRLDRLVQMIRGGGGGEKRPKSAQTSRLVGKASKSPLGPNQLPVGGGGKGGASRKQLQRRASISRDESHRMATSGLQRSGISLPDSSQKPLRGPGRGRSQQDSTGMQDDAALDSARLAGWELAATSPPASPGDGPQLQEGSPALSLSALQV